jgi:Family of unknown function (DUF6069)
MMPSLDANTGNANSGNAGGGSKEFLRTAGLPIVGAGVVNSVLGLGAKAAGVDMAVKGFGSTVRESIPPFAYFVSSIIGGIVGVLLVLLMKRLGKKRKVFLIVTIALSVLSLGSPLAAEMSSGTKVILLLMHVIGAVIIIPVLSKSLKD